MSWSSSRNLAARVGATALAFVLGASASAGTLYSWKTEDGTFAYTNDKKRIPTRYKNEVESSKLRSMESYARFTPGPKTDDKAYGDRIVERLEVLRATSSDLASSGGGIPLGSQAFVKLELGQDGSAIEIPIGAGLDDLEPVVVEHVRMKSAAGRTTTRHFRIVKQGDRVLAVIKDEIHDYPPTPVLNEEDFDSNPFE